MVHRGAWEMVVLWLCPAEALTPLLLLHLLISGVFFFFQAIHSVAWHHEGKQFICSHSDGTLTIWNVRGQGKPVQTITPHGKARARRARMTPHDITADGGNRFVSFGDYCHFNYAPPLFTHLFPPGLQGGRVCSFEDASLFIYFKWNVLKSALLFLPTHLLTWWRPRWDEEQVATQRNKGRNQSKGPTSDPCFKLLWHAGGL